MTLRFLQIHFFYEEYLESFYRARPALVAAPFPEQMEALLRDGFSAVHLIAPHLGQAGYEAQLVIANCAPAQLQWRREHGLPGRTAPGWTLETLRRQIAAFDPDVLYLSEPIRLDARFLATLERRPRLVLGWRAANIPHAVDWSGFDLLLSALDGVRQAALALGAASASRFWPGFPEWIHSAVAEVEPVHDVVFAGRWSWDQHARRNGYLEAVAAAGYDCAFHLSGELDRLTPAAGRAARPACWGLQMHRALRAGRIVLDARGSIGRDGVDLAGAQTANMRLLEATGSGAFLLAEHHENIAELFLPGVELETFRDEQELLEKVRWYLAHPREREAIARRGCERCLRDHSMSARVRELDSILRRRLAG